MSSTSSLLLASMGSATALQAAGALLHPTRTAVGRAPVATTMVQSWYDSGVRLTEEPIAMQPFYCNDQGCWIGDEPYFCNDEGCWIGVDLEAVPVTLPDGRTFSPVTGVQSHAAFDENLEKTEQGKRLKATMGLFAAPVKGAKALMGAKELNVLRADIISKHSKVISAFVDTHESPFGQIVLRKMFEAADKDDNGTLDRQEIQDALHALGFTFVEDKQLDQIFKRADSNKDEVIDFEEFVKETPRTLRSSLIKLAKTNGHDLGFLA
jgi:hypothetical protein